MNCRVVLIVLLFQVYLVKSSESATRNKRLVLHSDVDIAKELQDLKQEIAQLKTGTIHDLRQEIAQLKTVTIHDLKEEIVQLKADKGSTYIRWGRTVCNGTAEKVYTGFAAGSPYDIDGAASYICLPATPTWGHYVEGIQNVGGYVSGTEYQVYTAYDPFGKPMSNQDVPCAVCRTPRPTTLMIPGKTDCYAGWNLEYTGYLMTGHHNHKGGTDYACVDIHPEAVYHGEADLDGKLMYFAEVKCGSLPCQEYPNGRELACAVCSK